MKFPTPGRSRGLEICRLCLAVALGTFVLPTLAGLLRLALLLARLPVLLAAALTGLLGLLARICASFSDLKFN